MDIQTDFFVDHTKEITKDFLQGKEFDPKLSSSVLNNIDLYDTSDYKVVMESVKSLLNRSVTKKMDDFFFVETQEELTNKQKVVLIRFINMCHKETQYLIFVNTKLVYLPESYEKYNKDEIHKHIEKNLHIKERTERAAKSNFKKFRLKLNNFLYPVSPNQLV